MLSKDEIINKLQNGAVGIIPTDTVYGIVCRAADPAAVRRLYSVKHRENKPGTIIAASIEQLVELGVKHRYLKPIEHYWPNPLSVVVPVGLSHQELHLGKMSLAFRIPNNDELLEILEQTGPLLTSSANQPGLPVAENISQAKKYFGNKVDFYMDGGDMSGHHSSTVIRIVDDAIEILRKGAVSINDAGEITHIDD